MPSSPDKSTIDASGKSIRLTVPKPLAEALHITGGEKVQWTIKGKEKLELTLLRKE